MWADGLCGGRLRVRRLCERSLRRKRLCRQCLRGECLCRQRVCRCRLYRRLRCQCMRRERLRRLRLCRQCLRGERLCRCLRCERLRRSRLRSWSLRAESLTARCLGVVGATVLLVASATPFFFGLSEANPCRCRLPEPQGLQWRARRSRPRTIRGRLSGLGMAVFGLRQARIGSLAIGLGDGDPGSQLCQ